MKQIKLKANHLNRNSTVPYIQQYLQSLGITKASSFLNQPDNSDELDPFRLDHMRKAVEVTHMILSLPSRVFVQVDSDGDGWTSAAILINYLKRRYPQTDIIWRLHKGKEHGIIAETVPEGTNLVFVPDAGSNDFKEQQALYERGIKVIILDHHEIEDKQKFQWSPAIIVNNQASPDFPNKSLSGAGVEIGRAHV